MISASSWQKALRRPPFRPQFLISEFREDDRKRETAEKDERHGSTSVVEKPGSTQLSALDGGGECYTSEFVGEDLGSPQPPALDGDVEGYEHKYVAEKLGSNQLRLSSGVDSALGMEVDTFCGSFGSCLFPA